jgi:cytochrome d ubiquinol oxidase subunit I
MGLIGTRSVSKQIPGIHEIMAQNRLRIQSGMLAVQALETLRRDRLDSAANKVLEAHKQDLGFGLLLKKYTADVATATPQMIDAAARDTIPRVAPMFWSFRLMVGMGMAMLLLFGWSFWASLKGDFQHRPRLLKLALWCLPLPWLSCELGWVVANTAVSRGPSTACCPPGCRCPPCRWSRCTVRWPVLSASTPCSWWWR